ncbi:MAG: pyruvate dehydrogenase complex dihydrolipoamide acetyltransferase [Chlamydiae bacterium]|nr:pyruvate dehydrogenase complex dihydrolipoamide acetyltransferase [Chlamydiota bacterium]
MPTTLTMPKLSPTMESGTLVKWMKKEGDYVKAGEVLFEVATDKATVEYNALDEGYLRKILVPEQGQARVNQAVAIFTETKGESIEGYQPEGIAAATQEEGHQEEEAVTKEKSKAQEITGLAQPAFVPAPPLENYQFEWPRDQVSSKILASPLAKKLAKEKGIDLASVVGTGPNGRITSEDLNLALPDAPATFGRKTPPSDPPGAYEEEGLSPMRKVIGERLQASKTFIPHFYVRQTIMVDELLDIREQLKACEIKLTLNDFIVRACALALRSHPVINSGYDSLQQKIIRFKTVDICVAVSIDGGLITPIVRYSDYKNLGEISTEIKYLAKKAKEGKLELQEYQGGSFTISNLGMYGIDDFVAVINPPQASILAVGGVKEVPLVKEGKIVVGKTMVLTLSSDHRVVDGAEAALFLQTVKKYLEHPAILLI